MSGKNGSRAQFYVFYLGWKECRGLWGREFVEPIIHQLVYRRQSDDLPKLTIECTKKEMTITQQTLRKKKVQKLKYPPIPTKDITYATQASAPNEDVVACIYLGYNPQTRAAVHLHVYRCDSLATASFFVDHLNQFIELPENKQRALKIEQELISKNQVVPRPSAYVGSAPSEAPSTRYGLDDRDDPYYDDRRQYYGSRENMARDGPRDMYRDGPRDMYRDGPRDMYRDGPRDMPRDGPRDMLRDGPRDMPRDGPRDMLRDGPRDMLRDDPRDRPRDRDPYARDPYSRGDYGRASDHRGYERDQRDYPEPERDRDPRDSRNSWDSPHELYPPSHYEPQKPPRSPRSPRGRDTGRDYNVDHDVYQSVTEELKAKLKGRTPVGESSPMLLPPKDYDTVHRSAGNLTGITERKSTNTNIVGMEWSRKSDSDSSDRGSNRNSYEDPYSKNDDFSKWRSNRPPGPITRAARSPEPRNQWNGDQRRAPSPEPRRPGYDGKQRRGRSPTRGTAPQYNPMARAMSPPPGHELRNTYFPPNDPLPNYLAPSEAGWGGRNSPRALSPSRHSRGDGSDDGSRYGGRKPKYTASNLGLIHGAPRINGGPRPRSDEGYLSMDRADPQPPRGTYEDNNFGYGKPKSRDYPRDESPPLREVVAGEEAHPELQDPSPDLPGSNQPFLY